MSVLMTVNLQKKNSVFLLKANLESKVGQKKEHLTQTTALRLQLKKKKTKPKTLNCGIVTNKNLNLGGKVSFWVAQKE